MNKKSWLVPIMVFILSLSALIFYQKGHDNISLATTLDITPNVWSLSSTDIRKVGYGDKGVWQAAVKENGVWTLPYNDNKLADELYIYSIIGNFAQPALEVVDTHADADLEKYGITESSSTVILYDNNGEEYALIRGNSASSTTTYVYCKLNHTVYTIPSNVFDGLDSSESTWRSKQLFECNFDNISKISFAYKSIHATLLSQTSDNENITFVSEDINDDLANEFVHFLQTSKIEQFITDDADAHVKEVYGFNTPALKCTIYTNDGNTFSLVIGAINKDENICYASINNSNNIVAIPYFDFSIFSSLYATLEENNNLL